MTRIQKLTGIAVVALIIGGGVGVAVSAARPHATVKVANAADTSTRSCAGMLEGSFEWRWSAVPLATNCDTR